MAILYRAMWSDSGSGRLDDVLDQFHRWIDFKSDGTLEVPATGVAEVAGRRGAMEVRVERTAAGDEGIDDIVRATLVESRPDGSRWTTTLRSWAGPACLQPDHPTAYRRLWIDVEAVTHDSLQDVVIRAPRLARDLLLAGADARRHGLPLSSRLFQFSGPTGAETLADHITNLSRDLPVVVFAPAADDADAAREDTMRRAVNSVAGMALVCCIDQPAVDGLSDALGRQYSVWGGAFRIYLPGADPAMDDEWRHRYFLPDRFERNVDTAAQLIVRQVAPIAVSRRAAGDYEHAKALLRRQMLVDHNGETGALLELVEAENERLLQDRQAANELLNELEAEKNGLLDEQVRLQGDVADLQERLERARSALRDLGHAGIDAPKLCSTASEAFHLAGEHLADHLVVPDAACRDLEDLDGTREAHAWGQASWNAFRALHAYGSVLSDPSRDPGDFWHWCKESGDPRVWPATPKKLAMNESESVRSNRTWREQRRLPVDRGVDEAGSILMYAHIKVAEGGGNLAPRIYFHVDKASARVHVGFFGPHKHMHNKST